MAATYDRPSTPQEQAADARLRLVRSISNTGLLQLLLQQTFPLSAQLEDLLPKLKRLNILQVCYKGSTLLHLLGSAASHLT